MIKTHDYSRIINSKSIYLFQNFPASSLLICLLRPVVVVVLLLSCVRLFVSPLTAALQAFLSFTTSWSLLKLMSIESVMPSSHLILCHPLLLLLSIFPSIRVFSNESALRIRWPKYWSFSVQYSSEYSGLISFGIDWFDLLAVQGTFRSLLHHYNLKEFILLKSVVKFVFC